MPEDPGESEGSLALYYHPLFLEHDTNFHPESATRLEAILDGLDKRGIAESRLIRPSPVDLGLLGRVHDPAYIAEVERICKAGGGFWDFDTYLVPATYEAALLAAGAAVGAVDGAMSGTRAVFALTRPPGHHARYDSAMGFCVFNNIAVAAQYAIERYGLKRVLIVDWDVHHGNGTQEYFYSRSDVLFFSTHQYPFYPGTGSVEEIGEGEGLGYTVNVPLPTRTGDAGLIRAFDEVLLPAAKRFRPELILVSAGYDSHLTDPIGGMAVTVAGFSALAAIVRRVADEIEECGGHLAAILEGGYNLSALPASVMATLGALQAPPDGAPGPADEPSAWAIPGRDDGAPDVSDVIRRARQLHGLG